jgi:hypothetical protein
MLTLLTIDLANAAVEKNQFSPDAALLAPSLRKSFGLADGADYSIELVQFVAEVQRSLGLLADGVIGQKTLPLLRASLENDSGPSDGLWPAGGSGDDRVYEHYRALCAASGFEPRADRPTLLAIRGVWLHGRRPHPVRHVPLYDDAFVLLRSGEAPFAFRGATHPYQARSGAAPDVDGDGEKDVGMIRPDTYLLRLQSSSPPIFNLLTQRGSGRIPAYRDTDHDARIDDAEKQASSARTAGAQVEPGIGAYATEVLLHPGYDALQAKDRRPFSSIGCQTASVESLQRVLAAGKTLDYVLADGVALVNAVGGRESPKVA